MKRILDTDPTTGTTSTFEYDDGEDKAYVHQTTDVAPILEQNKRQQTDGTGGWNKDRSMREVANIPFAVAEKWRLELGVDVFNKDHAGAVKKLLNSNEYS